MNKIIGTTKFSEMFPIAKGAYKSDTNVKWIKPEAENINFGCVEIVNGSNAKRFGECLYTIKESNICTILIIYESKNIDFIKKMQQLANFDKLSSIKVFDDLDINVKNVYYVFKDYHDDIDYCYTYVNNKADFHFKSLIKTSDNWKKLYNEDENEDDVNLDDLLEGIK